jgi:hypothetical protein
MDPLMPKFTKSGLPLSYNLMSHSSQPCPRTSSKHSTLSEPLQGTPNMSGPRSSNALHDQNSQHHSGRTLSLIPSSTSIVSSTFITPWMEKGKNLFSGSETYSSSLTLPRSTNGFDPVVIGPSLGRSIRQRSSSSSPIDYSSLTNTERILRTHSSQTPTRPTESSNMTSGSEPARPSQVVSDLVIPGNSSRTTTTSSLMRDQVLDPQSHRGVGSPEPLSENVPPRYARGSISQRVETQGPADFGTRVSNAGDVDIPSTLAQTVDRIPMVQQPNAIKYPDKVRCTLGGDWSRLGSPQTARPNMLSIFGLLSVTARFGIPRALTLTHLVAFQPPELCGCGFTQWHFSHCICVYFYSRFMSLVAEACLTREPKMVSLKCI